MDRIGQSLSETDFGIVCLTENNIAAPWINFEAGALSKSVTRSHVIPLLCGMNQIDVANSPLRQFQYAEVKEDEMRRVIVDINANCDKPLSPDRLGIAFAQWWPIFLQNYEQIEFHNNEQAVPEDERSRLGRIETALEVLMSDMKRMSREQKRENVLAEYIMRNEEVIRPQNVYPTSNSTPSKTSTGTYWRTGLIYPNNTSSDDSDFEKD